MRALLAYLLFISMRALLAYLLVMSVANAAEWQTLAQECAQEIDQQAGCTTACVNKLFPEWVRCANARLTPPLPQGKIEMCIRQVQKERAATRACELCGDPVRSAFDCAVSQ